MEKKQLRGRERNSRTGIGKWTEGHRDKGKKKKTHQG